MIPDYKNDSWLKDQIAKKRTPEQMADDCQVAVETVNDHLRKNRLAPPRPIPEDISDHMMLTWCGQNRRPIPPDVTRATIPKDNARVVVLGAGGFVGTNLINYFKANTAYDVIGLTRADCDAMNRPALDKKFEFLQPDVVVNLSAYVGGIGLNKDNPADMIYRNLMMSANVVDACFTAGIRKLVFLGTVCSYPHTPPNIPFVETDLWTNRPEPTNEPYGVAKKTIGLMLDAYKRQFGFSSAYLIPTNMYGPHDDFSLHGSHVIPAMIRRFLDAKTNSTEVVHWGDGTASRDFLYVDDCCEAIRLAIENVDEPLPINVGSSYECSMMELSIRLAEATGYTGLIRWDANKPNGQPRRCLETTRALMNMGFEPRTELALGLQSTVDWYINSR